MLAALLIVFREVLEAGLIIGVTLAATEGVQRRFLWVTGGILAGLIGAGQDVFNAAVLIVAVVMLSWHILWMSQHGREMSANMKAMGRAVVDGDRTLWAIAVVTVGARCRRADR